MPETSGNNMEETRSRKLLITLLLCVGDIHDLNTVDKFNIDLSGIKYVYHACKSFKDWYID